MNGYNKKYKKKDVFIASFFDFFINKKLSK